MNVTSRREGALTIVGVTGEVDLYSSPQMREAVVAAAHGKSPRVIVDLSGVTYMDSSGIATLVEGLELVRKASGSLVLAGLTPRVREVFELARLHSIFDITADVATAMKPAPPEAH